MDGSKRITADLPAELLAEAMTVTGKGMTETLVEGLRLIRRRHAAERVLALKSRERRDPRRRGGI